VPRRSGASRAGHGESNSRIAVGWDRSVESKAAVNAATAIARALQSELRIVEVLDLHGAGTEARAGVRRGLVRRQGGSGPGRRAR